MRSSKEDTYSLHPSFKLRGIRAERENRHHLRGTSEETFREEVEDFNYELQRGYNERISRVGDKYRGGQKTLTALEETGCGR